MLYVDSSEVKRLADDLAETPAKTDVRAGRAVDDSSRDIERDAKAFAPVDKGELRASIHTTGHGMVREVVAGTDHAEYVEDGTSEMAPQPYMRPALDRHKEGLVHALEDIVGDFL